MEVEHKNRVKNKIILGLLLVGIGFGSCTNEQIDEPIPAIVFSQIITIPVTMQDGDSGEFSGGVRGLIIYRKSATQYIAYERNCSYHPTSACATVNIDPSRAVMYDPCCGSYFSFSSGNPTSGPAWRPLRRYKTELSGSLLSVTDEVIP